MGAIIDRLRQWWDTSDRTQKLVTVFGGLFLVFMLGATMFFASRPKMQPVIPGLSATDAATVSDELSKGGFKVEISQTSEVLVPSADVARAKMYLASKNKLPKSSTGGLDLIESIGIGDSQRKENEKIIAAEERKLQESIDTMDGVQASQVHLTLGKDSPFGDQTLPPTATVRIQESADNALSTEAATAIARLVQGSVTGLTNKNVTVVTTSGRMVYDGAEEGSPTSNASRKMEAESAESRRRTTDLQRELDLVFGKGNTIVKVDVQLNMDETSIQKDENLRSGDAYVEESATEKMTGETRSVRGAGGIESNVPGQAASANDSGKQNGYESKQKSVQYPTSNIKTSIQKAAGEITAMNVSVMANRGAIKDLQPLQQRVASYISPWQGDPKFTQSVTGVEFSTAESAAQQKAAADAASMARMQQLISLVPVGALVLVAIFLMKSLANTIKKSQHQTLVLSNGDRLTVPANSDPKLLALIEEATRPVTLSLPGSSGDDETPEATEVDPDTGEMRVIPRKKKKRIEEDEDDEADVEAIKRRVDVPLEQIRKMSRKNPEAVAMLLKSWMMEESR